MQALMTKCTTGSHLFSERERDRFLHSEKNECHGWWEIYFHFERLTRKLGEKNNGHSLNLFVSLLITTNVLLEVFLVPAKPSDTFTDQSFWLGISLYFSVEKPASLWAESEPHQGDQSLCSPVDHWSRMGSPGRTHDWIACSTATFYRRLVLARRETSFPSARDYNLSQRGRVQLAVCTVNSASESRCFLPSRFLSIFLARASTWMAAGRRWSASQKDLKFLLAWFLAFFQFIADTSRRWHKPANNGPRACFLESTNNNSRPMRARIFFACPLLSLNNLQLTTSRCVSYTLLRRALLPSTGRCASVPLSHQSFTANHFTLLDLLTVAWVPLAHWLNFIKR